MAQPADSTEIVSPLYDCAIKKDNFAMLSPITIYKILEIKTIAIALPKNFESGRIKNDEFNENFFFYEDVQTKFIFDSSFTFYSYTLFCISA